jgi:hypothetical protein
MAMIKAVVSDKDGIIHELVLRKRDEALRVLQREIAPPPGDVQLISVDRSDDGRPRGN